MNSTFNQGQIKSRFPLSKEAETTKITVIDAHCPICEMQQAAMRFVYKQICSLTPPKVILYNLKRHGYVPRDHEGAPIQCHEAWERAISFHMMQCLNEDPIEYKRQWQEKEQTQRLHQELNQRISNITNVQSQSAISLNPEANRENAIATPSTPLLETPTPITSASVNIPAAKINKDDLMASLGEMLPQIILNQLRIIQEEQTRYLNGDGHVAYVDQVKTLATMKALMQSLFGVYGMGDILEDAP